MKQKEYALYKGDDLLGMGTAKELAELRGCNISSIRYLGSPAYRRKIEKRGNSWNTLALILFDEEDDNGEVFC